MEETLEVKQQFLRSEIIDQGYDPNDFSKYMGTIRGEEDINLDSWSLSDIQQVVSSYKQKISELQQGQIPPVDNVQNPETSQYQSQEQIPSNENAEIPETTNNPQEAPASGGVVEKHEAQEKEASKKRASILSNKVNLDNPFADYEEKIQCIKLENSDITERDDLSIEILNPTKVSPGGLFSMPYYVYQVHTNPIGYKVTRKLADFTLLSEKLPLFNPGVFNPELPNFEFGLKDDSPKKILYIQTYLNSLIQYNYFRSLPIFIEFITLPQEQWEKKKNEIYKQMKESEAYTKMPNLEGEILIKISKEDDDKGMKIKNEISLKRDAYDKLNETMDALVEAIEKMNACLKDVSVAFWNLSKTHTKNQVLNKLFTKFSNIYKKWAEDYEKQKLYEKDNIKYFFKLINKESTSYLKKYDQFYQSRDEYKTKFEKIKKNKAHTVKDEEELNRLKRYYGFLLVNVNEELRKLEERQNNRVIVQMNNLANNKEIFYQDFINCIQLLSVGEVFNEEGSGQEGGGNVGNNNA